MYTRRQKGNKSLFLTAIGPRRGASIAGAGVLSFGKTTSFCLVGSA
jgi:hypothetical protein